MGFVVVGHSPIVMFLKLLSDSFPIREDRTGTIEMDMAMLRRLLRAY